MKPADRRQLAWFLAIGCSAALLHWGVVWMLVRHAGLQPLVANVAGWAVAWLLSFSGHHALTFRGHGAAPRAAAARFALLSFTGFLVNEAAYALLLRWWPAHFGLALAAVLLGVAGFTWWAGRRWAFARSR